ncbi:MAG: TIGR03915 family putative DNA repair protein [Granulosicoccus sp.]
MITVNLEHEADFTSWREQARALVLADVEPANVIWHIEGSSSDLFATEDANTAGNVLSPSNSAVPATRQFSVPREFITLAEKVVCHQDDSRFALLYQLLWRMTHGEHKLLQRVTDDDVHTLTGFAKAVSRDRHKMTAFVRFRKTPNSEHEHYSAWFEPTHHILRLSSDFFCKRFSNMHWSIFTPQGSAHWNQSALVFKEAGTRQDVPETEVMEQLWCTYFSSTFNPARLRLDAMQAEMPVKYWKNLPEAHIIARLTREAESRTRTMLNAKPTQAPRFARSVLSNDGKAPDA